MSRISGMSFPCRFTPLVVVVIILLLPLPLSSPHAQTELRVGAYVNPPKLTTDANGNVSGILGDLLQAMAAEEGWQLQTVHCNWNECLELLENGSIDLMPDVALTDDRSQRFDFHSVPALMSWSQIYTAPGRPISSLFGLEGLRVAVLSGSVQESYLQELADSFGLTVQWIPVNSFDEGFLAIQTGAADATAANHHYGNHHVVESGVESSPVMFEPSRLFYAAPANRHGDILARIDSRLAAWQQDTDSAYFTILESWLPESNPVMIPTWVWWVSLGLAGALVLAMAFNHVLSRRVTDKTRHLHDSEQRLNTILDSVDACIYIKGRDYRYQYVNRNASKLLGLPPEKILGHTDEDLYDPETCARLNANDTRVLEAGERFADEESLRVGDTGQLHTFLSAKIPLLDDDGNVYALCGISTDITDHRRVQKELHKLAFYDPLTGLANRRLLLDRLKHALAVREQTGFEGALLIIDIDNFKSVNDTLGYAAGDQLLVQVAKRLESHMRSTDTVARLSADEFVVIMESLDNDAGQAVMQARDHSELLHQLLVTSLSLNDNKYNLSVSMGIAMFSDTHSSVDDMMKNADIALTAAKRKGRGSIRFFNQAMQSEVNRRSVMEAALRDAINNNSLTLHLQPQVNNQGDMLGMEGLLRWNDRVLGQVPPVEFIPLAESTGLILPIGRWVLQQAGCILQNWSRLPAMREATLAINISPAQFRHPDFVKDLERCIQEYRFNPGLLELEITEGLLIDNPEQTAERMHELRRHGFRFSLDDFGTGYASLGYLKRLPLQQLKIDQSFVRDLLTDPNDAAIVRTILALGDSLDLEVIAEGVETEEQATRLREMGCRKFQGYHFGRPDSIDNWKQAFQSPA